MLNRSWVVNLQHYRRETAECNLGTIRCDAQGHIYVADPPEGAILKFASSGTLLLKISGHGEDSLKQPRDTAIDRHGNLFVADPGLGRIVKFDSSGRRRGSISPEVPARRIVTDRKGFLYLHAPSPQGLVHKYTPQAKRLLSFTMELGPQTRTPTPPFQPREAPEYPDRTGSLAADQWNRVYFAPDWTYDIQRFNASGHITARFKRRVHQKQLAAIVDETPDVAWTVVISDIAIAPNRGRLYVLRSRRRKGHSLVDVWSTNGDFERETVFDHPAHSIACDAYGNIYLLYSNITKRIAIMLKYTPL